MESFSLFDIIKLLNKRCHALQVSLLLIKEVTFMDTYLIPIKAAFILFPFIAVFITFPYMIFQYRKYGSIPWMRSLILYSFILYMLCMYLLIILPFPSKEEVLNATGPVTQLLPLQFIKDFLKETVFVIGEPNTWLPAIKQNCFLQVIFNILLFVPFGIYARYYFGYNWKKVFLFSFLLSLFFELTQLSGLYGIYPRAYRLFDVDDLFLNTSGGMIGFFIEPIFGRLLPSRKILDEIAYRKGKNVSIMRRILAFIIDSVIIGLITVLASFAAGGMYFILVLYFTKGYTPGLWILRIRIADKKGNAPSLWQAVIRNGILYYGMLVPFLFIPFILFLKVFSKKENKNVLFYEQISDTKCVSVIEKSYYYKMASL